MPAGRDLKSPNFLYIRNAEAGTYSTLLADFGEVTSVEYLEGLPAPERGPYVSEALM